jgi:hypothetical protein
MRLEQAQRRLNMGKSRLMWLAVLAALVFAARGASAQAVGRAFGEKGQVAISAERLLGLYVQNVEAEPSGTATFDPPGPGDPVAFSASRNTEVDSTTFVLLGSQSSVGPAAIPRLAVDFFVIDRLSIGGSLLYWTDSSESDTTGTDTAPGQAPEPANRETSETTVNTFGIAPRVGYAYMFSPTFGIWPRGGISYVRVNTEDNDQVIQPDGDLDNTDTETTVSVLSLTLEGLFVISPFEHVAFGVGPFLDFGLTGDIEIDRTSTINPVLAHSEGDLSSTTFGITSALIAWF